MRAQVKALVALSLWLALGASSGAAASKDAQAPDREMLRMMEFLRDIEMIKQMEMLQDMQHLENGGTNTAAPQKTAPTKKKETVK
jgi:hypothetical protein